VGSFAHINVEIVVGQNGTPCRRNADDLLPEVHLVDHFTD
jgi:hypothetical protein